MNIPLVSVIVATYRRDYSLINALESLSKQTYSNIEIVLVDDNADALWNHKVSSVVQSFQTKYPTIRFQYSINLSNHGSARTRNIGIHAATGEYVTFLDDDDVFLPERIEMQLRDMIASGADYGITDLYLYSERNELIDKRVRSYIKSADPKALIRYHLLQHMTGTDSFMFRTEYIRKIGGFPCIDIGDEFYLMLEAIMNGGKFTYSNHCFVKAYVHFGEFEGLSSGEKKIIGENTLFQEKKKYFRYLSKRDIRYVEMRHYAVNAFTELRRKNRASFMVNAFRSLLASPVAFIKMILEHSKK